MTTNLDLQYCLENAVPRLYPTRRIAEFLEKDIVYRRTDLGGLPVAFVCEIDMDEGQIGNLFITHTMLKTEKMTSEQLVNIAMDNSAKETIEFASLSSFLAKAGAAQYDPDIDAFVLTNTKGQGGASLILSQYYRLKIYEKFNGPYYILPSSRHEVIVIKKDNSLLTMKALVEMVHEVNETTVSEQDYLSDDIYICDGGKILDVIRYMELCYYAKEVYEG